MISSSARYKSILPYDHVERSYAELWSLNQYVKTFTVTGGSLTVDRTAEVMRRATINIPYEDSSSIPGMKPKLSSGAPDPMWPTGSEFKLYSGLVYPDGTEEMFPQGVFRLSKPKTVETVDGGIEVSVDGYDRSKALAKNRFIQPYVIPDGTNVRTALIQILSDRLPNVNFALHKLAVTSYTLPQTTLKDGGDSNPNQDCIDIAQSAGLEFFFDVYGDPVTRRLPDPNTTPVQKAYTEDSDCTLEELSRDLDEEQAYSGVIVIGEHPDQSPVLAQAWDTDPQSPTYVGTYGYVPYFVNTQFIKDSEASKPQDIATQTLLQVKGIIEQINFTAFSDFTHEAGDVISVKRTKMNVNGTYVMDSFQRGLEEGASMQTVTRKQRVS